MTRRTEGELDFTWTLLFTDHTRRGNDHELCMEFRNVIEVSAMCYGVFNCHPANPRHMAPLAYNPPIHPEPPRHTLQPRPFPGVH